MYKVIKDSTKQAMDVAMSLEKKAIDNGEEIFKANPHTSVYKILMAINDFNNL